MLVAAARHEAINDWLGTSAFSSLSSFSSSPFFFFSFSFGAALGASPQLHYYRKNARKGIYFIAVEAVLAPVDVDYTISESRSALMRKSL